MEQTVPTANSAACGNMGKESSPEKSSARRVTARDLNAQESWIVLALLLLVFNAVKLAMIEYSFSDENVYFYMGKLVSEGLLPYRDFRFAHPPLKLIPPALIFLVYGFHFTALKLLPVVFTNISALLIYLIIRRSISQLAGVFTVAAFLFSFAGLYYSSYYMGTNMTVVLLIAAFYLNSRRNEFLAGMVFGASLLSGIYAACALAAVGAHLMVTDKGRLKGLVAGFVTVYVPVNLALVLLFGREFVDHVYLFHFLKTASVDMSSEQTLVNMLKLNPALVALTVAYPFCRNKEIDLFLFTAASFIFFFFLFPSIHDYYFVLAAPFLAMVAMPTFLSLMKRLRISHTAFLILITGALAVYGGCHLGKAKESIAHSAIPQAPQMAKAIEETSAERGYIFGQGEIASLLALLSDRRILQNHVDSNGKVYRTGKDNLEGIIKALSEEEPTSLITKEKVIDKHTSLFFGPMVDIRFREYVLHSFAPVQVYVNAHDPAERIILFGKKSSGRHTIP